LAVTLHGQKAVMDERQKTKPTAEDREDAAVDADDTGILENEREIAKIEIDRAIGSPEKQ
jgi:hypothetical protein